MPKQKRSATLDACIEVLSDFTQAERNLPSVINRDGQSIFGPYQLTGEQVGAVALLLWKAKKLEQENMELNQMLNDLHHDLDRSISYLDPE